jgi:hypothetical protein
VVEKINYFRFDPSNPVLDYDPKNNRIVSLLALLQELNDASPLPSKMVRFYLGDKRPINRSLSYASKNPSSSLLIPDFIFDKMVYATVEDYSAFVQEFQNAGKTEPKNHSIGWAGNLFCHKHRLKMYEISKQHPDQLTITHYSEHEVPDKFDFSNQFVGPYDVVKNNKYVIDIEGVGYSGRVKLLLHCGRPLFLQDRPLKEYYYQWLIPYEHYIPVKRDLSDLMEQYEWAESHPKEVEQIATNAQHFAAQYLTKEFALSQLRKAIETYN